MHHFGFGLTYKNIINAGVGTATLTGTATAGQLLTVVFNNDDPEGPQIGSPTYQWYRGVSTQIPGATSSTYSLVSADIGSQIKCRVNYVDANSNNESIFSNATAAVIAATLTCSLAGQFDLATSNTTTPTQNGVNIGTAAADRWIAVVWYGPASSALQAGLTINGVSASLLASMAITAVKLSVWILLVPAGTTANIVGTYSGSPNNINTFVVYHIVGGGALGLNLIDSANVSGSSGVASKTFATVAGGAVIGAVAYQSAANQTITSGLTLDGQRVASSNRSWYGHQNSAGSGGVGLSTPSFTGNRGLVGASLQAA